MWIFMLLQLTCMDPFRVHCVYRTSEQRHVYHTKQSCKALGQHLASVSVIQGAGAGQGTEAPGLELLRASRTPLPCLTWAGPQGHLGMPPNSGLCVSAPACWLLAGKPWMKCRRASLFNHFPYSFSPVYSSSCQGSILLDLSP